MTHANPTTFILKLFLLLTATCLSLAAHAAPPNIVLLFADDLGYGEVGSYGQQHIRTPNLDRLAREGMRFTQFYSGSPLCAPSRCTLLTGFHTGHSYIRNNSESGPWRTSDEGQRPITPQVKTLGEYLQHQGYKTAAIGKWGLGGPDTYGHPNKQGFDLFYGYLCQRQAHNYYPTHLWHNEHKDVLIGNDPARHRQQARSLGKVAADWPDLDGPRFAADPMIEHAERFIRDNKDNPFFLYYPTPVPHLPLQVPADSLEEYAGQFEETPYPGNNGYLPHKTPKAAYAAMITRMDRDFGRILDLLDELNLADNTLVMFTSDNGPTPIGGVDYEYFNSAAGFRGYKSTLYEGGLRVPTIVRFPGRTQAGSVSDHAAGNWDIMPTILEAIGTQPSANIDGISFLPTLLGKGIQKQHESLYWELGPNQAVRSGNWKLVRTADRKTGRINSIELFNLASDPAEQTNLAESHPTILKKMLTLARTSRVPSKEFPSPFDRE